MENKGFQCNRPLEDSVRNQVDAKHSKIILFSIFFFLFSSYFSFNVIRELATVLHDWLH